MSITDELRAWAKGSTLSSWTAEHLTAIADHIDAEYEAKVAYWQEASYRDGYDEGFASADDWLAQHEDAMAEHGWIRLPKDADGEYIHVGGEVEEVDYDGHASVFEVRMTAGGWWVCAGGICRRPDRYRHYHAPTVEDVLREFSCVLMGKREFDGDVAEAISEYAAKLRLAEEDA